MIAILLSGCSISTELGFWVNEKPYRGTLEKNKFHVRPYWQCIEDFKPFKNKEC